MKKARIILPKTRFFIEVFLWETRKELHKNTKQRGEKLDYGAIYKPEPYIIYPRKKVKSKLGEIHLYKGRTGVGLLSHESLHCIFDYTIKTKGNKLKVWEDDEHLEKLCGLEGELVRRIANWLIKIKAW